MAKGFISREAGAVLSKKNKSALQLAFDTIVGVLEDAGVIAAKADDQSADDNNANNANSASEDDQSTDTKKKSKLKLAKSKESASGAINRRAIEAAGFSWADLATLLQNAVNDLRPEPRDGEYVAPYRVIDIFDDYFVYCIGWSGTEYYRVDYIVADDGTVTLGTPIYINRKVTYIAPAVSDLTASEAGAYSLREDFVQLVESAVAADGTTLIKLIAPGLGSSGLYTPEVLQRDGASAFPRGTKMFWDHDTIAEETARPEGTLTRFAAVLEEDARYDANGKAGAGLYARATVKERFRDDVNDLAKDIGVSIRADGSYKMGDYNGARVPIITAIKPSNGINNRVDFVTAPGAGGRVLSLFESARQRQPQADHNNTLDDKGDQAMTDEQIAAAITKGIKEGIAPLETKIARLQEASTLREARTFADQTLAGPKYSTLPKPTRDRIAESVAVNVPLTESGAIDAVKLLEAIEAAAKDEAAYLSSATGRTIAIGLGESRAPIDPPANGDKSDGDEAEMTEIFTRWGLTEAAADHAVRGRAPRA